MEEIFTRGWEDLIGRWAGPMSLRIIIQPAVAIVLAIRSGLKDAREGRRPFLWCFFSSPDHRRELLRHGWKEVGTVFIVALILDSIYQVLVHAGIYTLELLITATILAIVPYCLVRGLVTRIARQWQPACKSTQTEATGRNQESIEEVAGGPGSSPDVKGDRKLRDSPTTENNDF
jgi:hypothetical protein